MTRTTTRVGRVGGSSERKSRSGAWWSQNAHVSGSAGDIGPAGTAGASQAEAPAPEPKASGKLKVRQGIVVSDKADKTITVRIDVARQHRLYKKIVRTSTTLHAHDEQNDAGIGDTVRVVESRPLSRTKRWRLVEILERAR